MTEIQKQQRDDLLAATPADQRSEVAARFDHQIEADWLATAEPTDEERHEAMINLNSEATCEFVENCGYRSDQVYARLHGGMLPAHLLEQLTRVQTQPHPEDAIVAEVHKLRARQLSYLRARYGVTPTSAIGSNQTTKG